MSGVLLNDATKPVPVNLTSARVARKVNVTCDTLDLFLAYGSPKTTVKGRVTVVAYKEDSVGRDDNPGKVSCWTIGSQADRVRTAVQGFAKHLDRIGRGWFRYLSDMFMRKRPIVEDNFSPTELDAVPWKADDSFDEALPR